MNDTQALTLVTLLQDAQRHPGMFFPVDESGISGFLAGIYTAKLAFFEAPSASTVTDDILRERGWTLPNALAPWAEMRARQYSLDAMIQEVLTIEIETLRRIYHINTD